MGFAPKFLHIDGDWRDHRLFAITARRYRWVSCTVWTPDRRLRIHNSHSSDLTTHRNWSKLQGNSARIVSVVDLSAVIFVVLALAWAVYLIPKALKHHDEMASDRLVESHSDRVRILRRKSGSTETVEVETEVKTEVTPRPGWRPRRRSPDRRDPPPGVVAVSSLPSCLSWPSSPAWPGTPWCRCGHPPCPAP